MDGMTNMLLTLIGTFIIGLGLNLTPCVYPMMAVTFSIFRGSENTRRGTAFVRALIYVLGIATMYSVLGVSAALTGKIFGSVLQNKWVLFGIAAVMLGMALSMFGLYQLRLPAWIVNRAAQRRGTQILAIYLSGLFVGVFAAPCIGPPIVALLTFVGQQGDPLFGFEVFFVLSLGLGLPYLILGTFSGLIERLPKSGVWMVWIERVFGVVLVALAGFYAIIALDSAGLRFWWPFCLIAGGVYLGFIEPSGNASKWFAGLKKLIGTSAIIVGILLPVLHPAKTLIVWEAYNAKAFTAARQSGQPVVLDFYADWCIPCQEMEHFTYTNAEVADALKSFKKIKVDLTDPSDPEIFEIAERFGIDGVPTLLFFDVDGQEIQAARVGGFIAPERLLQIIRSPRFQERLRSKT